MADTTQMTKDQVQLAAAVIVMARDLGFDPQTRTPFWVHELATGLFRNGWRRHQGRDPRDQKEEFLHLMLGDLKHDVRDPVLPWIRFMTTRLVEAGWSREPLG